MAAAHPSLSEKAALRHLMRTWLKTNANHQHERSLSLHAQIKNHPAWIKATTVGLFAPLPEEPDLLALMEFPSKRFAFPCLDGPNLLWRTASSPVELQPSPNSKGRLKEPQRGEWLPLSSLDCLMVPGLAFTTGGQRLGRGGGYYDRTLAAIASHTTALGICFTPQIVETLPLEPHDQPVHSVLHA